jgi:hypothetical protein
MPQALLQLLQERPNPRGGGHGRAPRMEVHVSTRSKRLPILQVLSSCSCCFFFFIRGEMDERPAWKCMYPLAPNGSLYCRYSVVVVAVFFLYGGGNGRAPRMEVHVSTRSKRLPILQVLSSCSCCTIYLLMSTKRTLVRMLLVEGKKTDAEKYMYRHAPNACLYLQVLNLLALLVRVLPVKNKKLTPKSTCTDTLQTPACIFFFIMQVHLLY